MSRKTNTEIEMFTYNLKNLSISIFPSKFNIIKGKNKRESLFSADLSPAIR